MDCQINPDESSLADKLYSHMNNMKCAEVNIIHDHMGSLMTFSILEQQHTTVSF